MKTDAITAHVGNQARTSIHVIVAADCMLKTKVPTTITAQATFFLTTRTVTESDQNRQGTLFLMVTFKDQPSRMNCQEKTTFPDGNISRRQLPVGFPSSSRKIFPVGSKPSGKVQTFPVSYSTVREGPDFPCQ